MNDKCWIPKFWVVMPAAGLWGSEGEPSHLPDKDEVRVFYHKTDAERFLVQGHAEDFLEHLALFECQAVVQQVDAIGHSYNRLVPLSREVSL